MTEARAFDGAGGAAAAGLRASLLARRWLRRCLLMLVASLLTLATPTWSRSPLTSNIAAGDLAGLSRTALLIAAAFGGIYLAAAGQRYLLSWVGLRVLATLRRDLFRHLQALPLGYHDTHIVGVTISRVINDVGVINDLLSQGLVTLVGDSVVLVGIVVVMLSMSPRLALLSFSVLPLMVAGDAALRTPRPGGLPPDPLPASPPWSATWPRTSPGCA